MDIHIAKMGLQVTTVSKNMMVSYRSAAVYNCDRVIRCLSTPFGASGGGCSKFTRAVHDHDATTVGVRGWQHEGYMAAAA